MELEYFKRIIHGLVARYFTQVKGVVSRKLQVRHRLRALHHGKIAKITKPKKHSKAKPKLAESLGEILVSTATVLRIRD